MSLIRALWSLALIGVIAGHGRAQAPPPRPLLERLQIPPEVPGAEVPPIQLPSADPKNRKEREEAINRLFPPLPPLAPQLVPVPGFEGRPLALDQLQGLALDHSPVLRQATANVQAARGAAIQAGLYPNPSSGYQVDQAGTASTAGLQGGFLEQTIVTAGKLSLARASALVEVNNTELALRRAQIDVFTQVRSGYFAVLVAQENLKVSRAMSRLTDEVYRIQVELVKSEQSAAYEPMQLRVLAVQARANLVQAHNRYLAAWKQMTAALGLPGLPPTELVGRADAQVPLFQYDQVLAHMLASHTDVLTGQNDVLKARLDLRRAQVTPIPDVTVRGVLQRDNTTPPFATVVSAQVGVPVPVWDRNQGNIQRTEALLFRATQQTQRAQNELTSRLADAFARYESGRTLVDYYRNRILPDQVRTYRGIYQRHLQDPVRVSYADVVVAQQILAQSVATYIIALQDFWSAVVDVAGLAQTNDPFQLARFDGAPPLPEACGLDFPSGTAPLPPPGPLRPDPVWPPAVPPMPMLPALRP